MESRPLLTPLSVCWCIAQVKIGMKFKDGFPMIERIRICFAKAPFIVLQVFPIYNAGLDVAELPGIATWLVR